MVFKPDIKQELIIGGMPSHIGEHPFAPGMPYGQEGRTAVVYQLVDEEGIRAFKVFKPRYRVPALVSLSRLLAPFADLPGLRVCRRSVLTPQQEGRLLAEHPDLIYSVVMPWIEGPSWMEVLLNGQEISPEESLTIARALASVLAGMEQEGLAHCDLSGPNILLPIFAEDKRQAEDGTVLELVDVEQMYGPNLRKPDFLPSGSSGYAHNTSHEGMWSPDADRFAGALLLVEILGWCDERVQEASWGESYFDPSEMQRESDRYHVLVNALRERWGESIVGLFEQSWLSKSPVECPTFGEWLMKLPESLPTSSATAVRPLPESTPTPIIQDATPGAQELSTQVEEPETTAVPTPTSAATAAATSTMTPATPVEHLFDDGLAAFKRGDWAASSELLAAVVYHDPGYTKDSLHAARLLEEVNSHLDPHPTAVPGPLTLQIAPIPQVPQHAEEKAPQANQREADPQQQIAPPQIPQQSAYGNSAPDAYYDAPPATIVSAPAARRSVIVIPALILIALLVVGGIIWFLAQNAQHEQEVAATSTATAVSQRDASATAVAVAVDVANVTSTANAVSTTSAVADANNSAGQTATSVSDNMTQVALYAGQTSVAQAADVTSTAQANAAITVQAQALATKQANVVETSVAIQATAKAIPPSAKAITVANRDRLTTLRTLQGHTDKVYGIAFSPDGQFLASGSGDNTAKIWRVSDGALVQTLQRENAVYQLAYSPDGKTLALTSDRGTELWNAKDGLLLRTFSEDTSYGVAFSADGLTVAAGLLDGSVVLWRVLDGSPLLTLKGHTDYVINVAYSPDQTMIAAGANDSTIRIWQAKDGTPIKTLIGTNRIQGIAFSHDGQNISASLGDDTIKQWRISDGALLNNITGVPTIGVTFSPDGQLFVAAGSWENDIRLWRASDGAQVGILKGHTGGVNGVAFSPDGATLASSSDDNTIRLWGIP